MPKNGALLAFLMLFVAACASKPEVIYREKPVTHTVTEYRSPPVDPELLRPCVRPALAELTTNGDLLDAAIAQDRALGACNADKDALRRYLERYAKEPGSD